jgi:hypothetical protein
MLPHFWELLPGALPFCNFFRHAFCPAHLQHIVTLKRHKELRRHLMQKDMPEKITPSYINIMRHYRRCKENSQPGKDFVMQAYNVSLC